jgi:hypothetical protein
MEPLGRDQQHARGMAEKLVVSHCESNDGAL